MKDDKEKLSQLGDLLAERMKLITKNFRLGFGSFIDKKVMPFVDPRKEKQGSIKHFVIRILDKLVSSLNLIDSPCSEGCAPTYGFRNQLTLTTNTAKFAVLLILNIIFCEKKIFLHRKKLTRRKFLETWMLLKEVLMR